MQGSGFVAECTLGGWQVLSRDCINKTDVPLQLVICNFLPTGNVPAGSKGWSTSCAGKADGETCQAACDGANAFFGKGYTAVCGAGEWTPLPGGGCKGESYTLQISVLHPQAEDGDIKSAYYGTIGQMCRVQTCPACSKLLRA
jgi:hypothetical protein